MKRVIRNSLKFNSKKGVSLVELIVAIMIIMIVVSASVSGLTISYRSVLMGAVKDDAHSVAKRDCDIVMNAIQTYASEGELSSVMSHYPKSDGKVYCDFGISEKIVLLDDLLIRIGDSSVAGGDTGYDSSQYTDLVPYVGSEDSLDTTGKFEVNKNNKKYRSVIITKTEQIQGATTYDVYHVKTFVYYTETSKVTCEGDVIVKQ